MKKLITFSIILTQFYIASFPLHARPRKSSISKTTPSKIISLILEGDFKGAGKAALALEKRLETLDQASGKFILGYVRCKMGRYEDAVGYFKEALAGLPLIQDHVKYFLGLSCLKSESYQCAAEYLGDVAGGYPDSVWNNEALWGLAQAQFGAGEYSEAMKTLAKVKPAIGAGPTVSEYNLFKASVLEKQGLSGAAAALLKEVYFDAESSRVMEEALKRLKDMRRSEAGAVLSYIKTFPAQVELGQQLIKRYHYSQGLDILEGLMGERGDLHMREVLADAYFKSRNYEKAKGLYEELTSGKKDPRSLYYLVRLAQSAARVDDFETAIDTYRKIIRKYSKGQPLYVYKLGFLYMDSGRYEEAVETFAGLIESGYHGHLRKDVLWNLGWCYYKLGKFDEAAGYFGNVAESGFGEEWRVRALYWMARCHEKKGAASRADSIYAGLINKDRFGYYGFLAAERLYGKRSIPNDWMIYEGVGAAPARRPPAVGTASAQQYLPKGLDKAKYLSDVGLKELAYLEVRQFNRRNVGNQDEAVSFMEFAREVGDFRSAHLVVVERFRDMLYQFPHKKGLRHFVWENWYPEAFPEPVEEYSRRFNVDGRLVYSIMREESRFATDVVSKADAIGLMQIIPPTAERLAGELKVNPFDLKDMFRPQINIKFGVKYLGDLSGLFDGEKVYMMASYNAGEDAVGRWIKNSHAEDMEEFIEEIPYDETNRYVKRVLTSYWIYKELQPKGSNQRGQVWTRDKLLT